MRSPESLSSNYIVQSPEIFKRLHEAIAQYFSEGLNLQKNYLEKFTYGELLVYIDKSE